MVRLIDLFAGHDARHRMILGSAAGAAVFCFLRNHVRLPTDVIAAWDTFAFFVLASAWLTILITPQQKLRARAQEQDFGRTVLFVSHEFGAVERFVERLVLVRGGVVFDGEPSALPSHWHDPSHVHL